MKKNFLPLLILAVLSFWCPSLQGQVYFSLTADTTGFATPDPVNQQDSLYFNFVVKNTGSQNYNDSLYIVRQVNAFIDTIATIPQVILDTTPSDSEFISTGEMVTPARYGGGINVVVIWPTAPNSLIVTGTDSLVQEVTVIGSTSLPEPHGESMFLVFPNPTMDRIRFRTNLPLSAIQRWSLLGTDGKLHRQGEVLPHQLSLSGLPKGLYFIHLEFEGGGKRTLRINRQ